MPHDDAAGLALIESFEGLVLFAYDDAVYPSVPFKAGMALKGTLTIGWGHTGPDVHPGMIITREYAQVLLAKDVVTAENEVAGLIEIDLTPNEFSSLVSFQFNTGALGSSPGLALINAGLGVQAWEDHLCLYIHGSTGQVLEDLVRRRAAEFALWKTP